ncbi:hypothetical protein C4565_00345 [Candidatus Parcubacteria bacterium]|nr:MAG: hypothetical protein C4565_00345 [Candidatus Parcubacteria bacterium]
MKPIYVWCIQKPHGPCVGHSRKGKGAPKVRCPECGKMFKAMTVDVEPHGLPEYVWYIPPHKKRV